MKNKYDRLKISITNMCNLNCSHCYLGEKDKLSMNTNLLFKRLDEAKQLGVSIIDLTGGEPLVHPDIKSILNYVGKKGFKKINISTNGILLGKEEILEYLKKYNIHCNISLDGITPYVISSIRGRNLLLELEPIFKILDSNKISYSLRFSLNNNNICDIKKMIEYSIKRKKDISIGITQLSGSATYDMLLRQEDIDMVKNIIIKYKLISKIKIEECFTNTEPCDGAEQDILSISTLGIPAACLMIKDTYLKDYSDEMSLKDMWKKIQKYKIVLKLFNLNKSDCEKCERRRLCSTGCLVTSGTKKCINFEV